MSEKRIESQPMQTWIFKRNCFKESKESKKKFGTQIYWI